MFRWSLRWYEPIKKRLAILFNEETKRDETYSRGNNIQVQVQETQVS